MSGESDLPPPTEGKLLANLMHFARALRAAGLPVGPGKVLDAARAVEAVGIVNRDDFYWTLHAVFVNRRDQRDVFDQTFHIFWKNPRFLERMMSLVLPEMRGEELMQPEDKLSRRVADAVAPGFDDTRTEDQETKIEIDASLTYSAQEVLQAKDFEDMSADEIAAAKKAIRDFRLPVRDVHIRRFRGDPAGARIAMRATLRAALRHGGHDLPLRRKSRRRRPPPIVLLCDISGSMARYSEMLLHFLHALTNDRDRVHAFLFGTRLSNVTRYLRQSDPDAALADVAEQVEDWAGGTRIGACLHEFNRDWSRRVLAQGAIVILISDGLDRDAGAGLENEIERLHKSCRRLIWLNPLLRYDEFQPRAAGIKALLPHVDDFRAAHNLQSLADLCDALGGRPHPHSEVRTWQKLAA